MEALQAILARSTVLLLRRLEGQPPELVVALLPILIRSMLAAFPEAMAEQGAVEPVVALTRPELYAYRYDHPAKSGDSDEEREHDPCFWFCLSRAALHAGDGKTGITFARTPKYVGRPMFLHRCFVEHHGSGSRLDRELTVAESKDVVQLQVADLIVWGFNCLIGRNPDPEEAEAFDRYAWWAERLSGLVLRKDCRLLSPEEAARMYAEFSDLCPDR